MRIVGTRAFKNGQEVQDLGHKNQHLEFSSTSFLHPTGAQLFSKSVLGACPTDKKDSGHEYV